MTSKRLESIQAIFERFQIKSSTEKFLLYLHGLITRHVFENCGAGEAFLGYADAWDSPAAREMRKYLPGEQIDTETLSALAEQLEETTGLEFIQTVTPDLIPGDLESLFAFLEQSRWEKNDRTLFYLLLKIWAVVQVQEEQLSAPYPASVTQLKTRDISARLFAGYQSWIEKHPKYKDLQNFGENEFFETWRLAFGAPFRPEQVMVKGKLVSLFTKLREKDFPEGAILAYYFMARTGRRFPLKKIDRRWEYFKEVFMGEYREEYFPELQESRSPGEWFFQQETLFEQCLSDWGKIGPKDFLRTLFYCGKKDASQIIELENCVPYAKLRQRLSACSSAVIVDANPDFIFRCLEEKRFTEKRLLFVLPSEILAQIYEEECNGKAEFAYPIEPPEEGNRPQTGGDLWPRLCLAKRDFDHKGRESVFKKEAITAQYETGLLFVRRQSLKMTSAYLTHIQTLLVSDGVLLLQSPHSVICEDHYSARKLLRNMSCREILLLPNNQHSDWLKKQLLSVWSPQRKAAEGDAVKVRKAFLALGQKDDAMSVICVEPWVLEIPQSEIMSGKKTINGLWEQYRPKPPKGKKRETKCYRYSEEIKVWYSLSNGRGRFSLYQLPTAAQARRTPLARGKRVTGPIPFRAKSVSEAEEKLRKRIFREPLKSTIQKLVESSCREMPITLRSFFFCRLDRLRENQGYRESIMEELLTTPSFGEISSADTVTLEEYQAKMEKEFGDRGKGEKLLLWRQLNLLLREGERWEPKRFYPNPISGYVNSLVEKDLDRQRMRESLAKRFFELREEDVIWESITRGLPKDSVLLGCAISFYTGMSNNEICALDWGDCQSISGKTGKQFLVYKRMNAKGEIRHLGTENRGTYRRVPIVSSLWSLLERRKEQVKKALGASEGGVVLDNELDTLPIVTEDTAAFEKRCSPSRLRAAKDRLERAAGITPLEGGFSDGQSQSSTDFNDYQGDLFRANFRQRALQTCLMSEAELNYLLGIALPNTFSKHYCDYINDFSQLLMAQKLERWAVLHPRRKPEVSFENALTGDRQTLRLQTGRYNQRVCTDLEIKAGPSAEGATGQLLLDIKDDCGVDVEFYTVARKGSGNELAG